MRKGRRIGNIEVDRCRKSLDFVIGLAGTGHKTCCTSPDCNSFALPMTRGFDHIDNVHTDRQQSKRRSRYTSNTCSSGFSLLEMLTVIVIISILAAVSAPSLMQISNSAARKGAVNVLLNAFEQARVAALTSGTNTYVGFADENFPNSAMRYRAFIIFRNAQTDDPASAGNYIPLTKWEPLPQKISIKTEPNSLVEGYQLPLTDNSIPYYGNGATLPCLVFNSTGAIQQPADSDKLQLFIYEGFFANGQDNFTRNAQTSSGALFERITFSRFTGRAQLDITTL